MSRLLAVLAFAALVACGSNEPLPPGVTIVSVALAPDSVLMDTVATAQFSIVAHLSDGSTRNVNGAVFTATGGTITSAGVYTSGKTSGLFRVVASDSSGAHADSSKVVIQAGATFSPGCGTTGSGATVTAVSRDGGSTAGGAKISLTGTGFQATDCVKFGSAFAAGVTLLNATTLQAIVPAGTVGPVSVSVVQNNVTSTLTNAFTYYPSATVTYATQPDDGTFGTLHPTPGTYSPVISTDTALPGQTYSVKQVAAANDANNHSVGFVFQPSNAAPANLGNPEAADPNGLYARWYTYFPLATVNAMNTAQGTGQGQMKVHLARSYNGVGQPWFEIGIGPEFPTGFGTGVQVESDFDTGVFYQHNTGVNLPAGQWVEWQVSYRRDTAAHIGYAKLWINGKLVGQSQHANYGSDNLTDQSSISTGMVYVQHVASQLVVYVGGIQLANGYIEPKF